MAHRSDCGCVGPDYCLRPCALGLALHSDVDNGGGGQSEFRAPGVNQKCRSSLSALKKWTRWLSTKQAYALPEGPPTVTRNYWASSPGGETLFALSTAAVKRARGIRWVIWQSSEQLHGKRDRNTRGHSFPVDAPSGKGVKQATVEGQRICAIGGNELVGAGKTVSLLIIKRPLRIRWWMEGATVVYMCGYGRGIFVVA